MTQTAVDAKIRTWIQVRAAALAAFGSIALIATVCWSGLKFNSDPSVLSYLLAIAAIIAAMSASASGSDSALAIGAGLASVCVILAGRGTVALFAGGALISAFYLHDVSCVMRRSTAVDPAWMRGRLTVVGGAAMSGALLAALTAAIGASRQWEALAVPLGVAAFAIGVTTLAFVVRRSFPDKSERSGS